MRRNIAIAVLTLLGQYSYCQQQDTTRLIEEIFAHYKNDQPGCQLAVSQGGKLIFSKAWGMADLEHQVPLSTTSVIEAGSVSKQFTAAAILLLEREGKLSLQDRIRKYLPELPVYTERITIAQMIHHTSGLKDWASLLVFSDTPRGTRLYSNKDILRLVSRQKSLNHLPGAAFMYSNTNYVLLAIILERVSGVSLADFTAKNFFKPLGMLRTQWRNDIHSIVSDRAIAYAKGQSGYRTDMPFETVYGNGGLLTTAEDLLKWNYALSHAKLLDSALLSRQLETIPLIDGKTNNYAAGLRLMEINNNQVIGHDGATAAYRAILEYYPKSGISIAWLSNTSQHDGNNEDIDRLKALLLHYQLPRTKKEETQLQSKPIANTLPSSATNALKSYTGIYHSSEVEADLEILLINKKLTIKRASGDTFLLNHHSAQRFRLQDSNIEVTFHRNKKGKVISLEFTSPKVRNVLFEKIAQVRI